jgi:hypothetical protein
MNTNLETLELQLSNRLSAYILYTPGMKLFNIPHSAAKVSWPVARR